MIKSAKRAINAILGNADINDEELITAIIGAEALTNFRPLTYQSADPSDDIPLTPNHFLHGQIGGHFAPASVDSRPLTYQSADPSDDSPLTPNHFLHGQIGGHFAPASVNETVFNLRKRWRRIQELVRHFRHRWLREWLPGLSARKKWLQPGRDIKVGEVVLVMSPDTTRGNWPLGRVREIYPGKDGRVRVTKIQVGQGALTRSVTKICPLESDN